MGTPLRRSRRLEGLKPLSLENLPDPEVSRVKRALVDFKSNPEETGELQSPRVPPLALESPRPQPETSPESPSPTQDGGFGSPQRQPEPHPGSLQPHQDLGLESPAGQTESGPESPQREQSSKLSPAQGEMDSEAAHAEEEVIPRSPEPCPGQQAPGPEPSYPAQELTFQAPSSPECQLEPSKLPQAGETVTGSLDLKKRVIASPQAPASKKLKKEELPVIPKGKPKSGRVWKDRSKKR